MVLLSKSMTNDLLHHLSVCPAFPRPFAPLILAYDVQVPGWLLPPPRGRVKSGGQTANRYEVSLLEHTGREI